MAPMPQPPRPVQGQPPAPDLREPPREARAQKSRKLDGPVPLSEFAKRGKSQNQSHSGFGRRDSLSAGERTRILRMLRDEGGRLADEESQVFIGSAPGQAQSQDYDFDFDDDSPPMVTVPPVVRPDVPAKPAVVVGLAQAQAARASQKRGSEKISAPRATATGAVPPPPPHLPPPPPPPPPGPRSRQIQAVAPSTLSTTSPSVTNAVPTQLRRPPPPVPFADEPTRQVDDELLNALRNAPTAKPAPKPTPKPGLPRPSAMQPMPGRPSAIQPAIQPAMGRPSRKAPLPRPSVIQALPDDPTRLSNVDALAPDDLGIDHEIDPELDHEIDRGIDDLTRPAEEFPPRFLSTAPTTEPGGAFDDHPEEATRLASIDRSAPRDRSRHHGPSHEERTRAVNIRDDPSISDIDWDLD
jgi:hypothetical protein